jgi:hypothetical protein
MMQDLESIEQHADLATTVINLTHRALDSANRVFDEIKQPLVFTLSKLPFKLFDDAHGPVLPGSHGVPRDEVVHVNPLLDGTFGFRVTGRTCVVRGDNTDHQLAAQYVIVKDTRLEQLEQFIAVAMVEVGKQLVERCSRGYIGRTIPSHGGAVAFRCGLAGSVEASTLIRDV